MLQFLRKLGIDHPGAIIDWEMTPVDTFSMFESRGGKERVRSTVERYFYFYIDNWVKPARLCFMERGIRHARVLARIKAPQDLIDACVASQGVTKMDQSYAIDQSIRLWLEDNVLDPLNMSLVEEASQPLTGPLPDAGLPALDEAVNVPAPRSLRTAPAVIDENRIAEIVREHDFFEGRLNPAGSFPSRLVDNRDRLTVTDLTTGLVWLRGGSGHGSRHRLLGWLATMNRQGLAGFTDWRLPTIEEGLSLLRQERNANGLCLHSCFTLDPGYIFTADARQPGGYWFIDLRQAWVYWAGGTLAGGYFRPCRTVPAG